MSAPMYDPRDVILRILASAGGRMAKKTSLNKAFYYAHLYYFKHTGGFLTPHPIVKAPNGPVADGLDAIISDMAACGEIEIGHEPCGPYEQAVFSLRISLALDCTDPRDHAIELAVQWILGRTAADLSAETHEFISDWDRIPLGAEIPIYRDLLSGEERAAIAARVQSVRERLLGA